MSVSHPVLGKILVAPQGVRVIRDGEELLLQESQFLYLNDAIFTGENQSISIGMESERYPLVIEHAHAEILLDEAYISEAKAKRMEDGTDTNEEDPDPLSETDEYVNEHMYVKADFQSGDAHAQALNAEVKPTEAKDHDDQTDRVIDATIHATDDTATATEDQTGVTAGNVLSNDDHDARALAQTVQGNYGTFTLKADGSYEYALNANAQHLAAGQVETDKMTYTITDSSGNSATATLSVAVTGTNDVPTLGVATTDSTHGTLNGDDKDTRDTLVYSVEHGTGHFGTLTVDPDTGKYEYTPNQSVSGMTYNPSSNNYSGTDTFTVKVDDGHGGTTTQTLTFNPTGTATGATTATVGVPTPTQIGTTPQTPPAGTGSTPGQTTAGGNQQSSGGSQTNHVTIDLDAKSDTGKSDTDNLTNDKTPTITGHTDMPFSTVEIFDGGKSIGTSTSDGQGNYTFTPTTDLSEGNHDLSATATAPSGAVGTSSNLGIEIDTSTSVDRYLDAASDTGSSHTDNLTNDTTPTIKGNGEPGAEVVITVNGAEVGRGTVDAQGHYAITTSALPDGQQSILTITSTDAAGNTATTKLGVTVDTTNSVSSDIIDASDTGKSQTDNITKDNTPTITGHTDAGSTVVITDAAGHEVGRGTADAQGNYSITTSPLQDGAQNLTVTSTDTAGNTATSQQAITVDTSTIFSRELSAASDTGASHADNLTNDTTPTIIGQGEPGATIVISVGGTEVGRGVVDASGHYSITTSALPEGMNVLDMTQTDVAGNTYSSQLGITVDTSIDATIKIDDITPDNTINYQESGQTIPVTGTVTGDFKDGDAVTVKVGAFTFNTTVDASGHFSVDVAGAALAQAAQNGDPVTAEITVTDIAGNSKTLSDSHVAAADLSADAHITLDPVTPDNIISYQESTQTIPVSGTVTGDFKAGDTVTVTVGTLSVQTKVDAQGHFSVGVSGAALAVAAQNGQAVQASVALHDQHGNTATDSASQTIAADLKADATIKLDAITPDDIINHQESGQNIPVTGTVTGDFKAGDIVHVTVGTVQTQATVDAQGHFSVDVAGAALAVAAQNGDPVTAQISVHDSVGNVASATDSHAYSADLSAQASISVDSLTPDDILNYQESTQKVPVTGTVGGDVKDGDTVTLSVNGNTYTGQVSGGRYSIDVPGSDLAADKNIHASVTASDAAGNSTTATADHSYGVDLHADAGITLDAITPDNIINAAESAANIPVTGTVTGDFKDGDTVTVKVGSLSVQTHVDASGHFSVDVAGAALAQAGSVEASISVHDAAGNSKTVSDRHSVGSDLNLNATDAATTATEDQTTVSTGQITLDPDAKVTSTDVAGQYGTYHFKPDGSFTYTLDNSNPAVQALANGATLPDPVSYGVTDTAGNTATAIVTATITGTNDGAVISGTDTGSVTEDNVHGNVHVLEFSGKLDITDVDTGEAKFDTNHVPGTSSVGYTGTLGGHLVMQPDGNYSYSIDNNKTEIQNLGAGEHLTDTIVVQAKDGTQHTISITINGTNDAPEISGAVALSKGTEDTDFTLTQAQLLQNASDKDHNDQGQLSVHNLRAEKPDGTSAGTFSDDGHGNYTFHPAQDYNGAVTFKYDVQDAHGGSTAATATTNLAAVQDAATLVHNADATVTEDHQADNQHHTTSYWTNIDVQDPDGASQQHVTKVIINGVEHTMPADFGATIQGAHGTFQFTHSSDGHDKWRYIIDNTNTEINELNAGEHLTDTMTLVTTDGTHIDVAATINGTNDAPTVHTGTIAGTEDIAHTFTAAEFGYQDAEHTAMDHITIKLVPAPTTGVLTLDGHAVQNGQDIPAGDIGKLVFTPVPDYHGDASFTYTVNDGHSDSAVATATLNIAAVNDAAIITGQDTGSVTEDKTANSVTDRIEVHGTLNVYDPDAGESSFQYRFGVSTVNDPFNGSLRIDQTGGWTYIVHNTDPQLQALTEGQTEQVQYRVHSLDGTSHIITLTVTGTNDAPTVSGAVTLASGTEDQTTVIDPADLLANATDVDQGETARLSVHNLQVDHGSVSVNPDGKYLYTPEPNYNGPVKFTYDVQDPNGASVATSATMNLAAVADAPTVKIMNDVNHDGIVSGNEISAIKQIMVEIDLPADAKVGDTLTITNPDGSTTAQVLSAGEISSGKVISSYTIPADGANITVSATITDQNGSTSPAGSASVTMGDTTNSVTADIIDSSDTGSSHTDNITKDNTPTITGHTDAGSTVVITDALGHEVGRGTADAQGNYVVTTSQLPDGAQNLTITSTDTAGNTATAQQAITVDTQISASITIDDITSDNNINAAEASRSVAVTGTVGGDVKDGDSVTLSVNGKDFTGTVSGGKYSIDVPGSDLAADAQKHIMASVTTSDAAGNTATAQANAAGGGHWYGVDTDAPTVTVNDIDFTKDTTPDITGHVDDPKAVVKVTVDGHQYTATVDPSGDWSVAGTSLQALGNGQHTVRAEAIDHANNTGTGSGNVTVGQTAISIDTIDNTLDVTTGSGAHHVHGANHPGNSDKWATHEATTGDITLHGSVTNVKDGEQVTIHFVDKNDPTKTFALTATVNNGQWTATAHPSQYDLSPNDDWQITASVTDRTGQKIDSNIEEIIDADKLTDSVNEGDVASQFDLLGDNDQMSVGNVQYSTDGKTWSTTVPAGFVLGADGHTLTIDPSNSAYDHLAAGQNSKIFVKYELTEGSESIAQTAEITVTGTNDTPVLSVKASDGTTNDSDNILNAVESQTAEITGTIDAGSTVNSITITDGTHTITVAKADITVDAAGNFTATGVDLSSLNDGTLTVTANATSVDGTSGTATSTIEKDATTTQVTAGLATASDTGTSHTDGITNDNTPTIEGQAEAGAKIVITDAHNNVVGRGTADATGHYSITTSTLPDDNMTGTKLTITSTDAVGNTAHVDKTIFIDTQISDPTIKGLYLDKGVSDQDMVTSLDLQDPNIGANLNIDRNTMESTGKLQYSVDGGTTWTNSYTPHEGVNSFMLRQIDAAGNTSAGQTVTYTVDNTVTAPTVTLAHDTGASATDMITKDGTLNITGTEPGAAIEYSTDGGTTWSTSFTAAEGANNVQVRQTDVAGNVSAASHISFTVDTTISATDATTTATEDQTSASTSQVQLDQGATVTSTDVVGQYGTYHFSPDGSFTYTLDNSNSAVQALTAGQTLPDPVSYSVTDTAGNTATATATATITGSNHAPTIRLHSHMGAPITEDHDYQFTQNSFAFRDVDQGDSLHHVTFTQLPDPTQGEILLNGVHVNANQPVAVGDIPNLIFRPALNFTGDVEFKYTVNDGHTDSAETPLSMNSIEVIAEADQASINMQVMGTDTDRHLRLDVQPTDPNDHVSHIFVSGLPKSSILSDGHGHTATVQTNGGKIDVQGWSLNDISIDIPKNIHTLAFGGTASLQVEAVTVAPVRSGITSPDTASVTANANVSIHHDYFSDVAPDATDSLMLGTEDQVYHFSATDFPFSDKDGGTMDHVTITDLPDATEGKIQLNGVDITAGQSISTADIAHLTFVPKADYNGEAHFKFTVSDGLKDSAEASGSIDLENVVDAPTLSTSNNAIPMESGNEDTAIALNISATAKAGDTIDHYTLSGIPAGATLNHGTKDGNGNWIVAAADIGGLTVTPPPDYHGGFRIEVIATATDGTHTADSAQEHVTVAVMAVNDAATFTGDTGSVTEDKDVTQRATAGAWNAQNSIHCMGQLAIHDVDGASEEHLNLQSNLPGGSRGYEQDGTYGHFIVYPGGTWVYYADNDNQHIQDLDNGQTLTDGIEITSADGTKHTIAVTIHGTTDTPVLQSLTDTGVSGAGTIEGNLITGTGTNEGAAGAATDSDSNAHLVLHDIQVKDPASGYVTITPGNLHTITGIGTLAIQADGHYTFTPAPGFVGSVPPMTYRIDDTGGAHSRGDMAQNVLNIEVKLPTPSAFLANDTGDSAHDGITNDATISVGNTVAGAGIEYSTDGGKHWSSSYSTVEGANSVMVRQNDGAGHVSEAATVNFTLDTSVTVDADLASVSDTGISDHDGITNDNTPTIQGNAEAGASIVITDGKGLMVGTGTADSHGHYSITTSQLADGVHSLTVTSTDTAGNTATAIQSLTVDTQVSPLELHISAHDPNDHTPVTDRFVNAAEKLDGEISLRVESGSTIDQITITDEDGKSITFHQSDLTGIPQFGAFSKGGIDLSGLKDGTLTVAMTGHDKAGNAFNVSDNIVKDTTAPTGQVDLMDKDNDGVIEAGEEGQVHISTLGLSQDATIQSVYIEDANGNRVTLTADQVAKIQAGHGIYVLNENIDLGTLDDGKVTLHIVGEDKAGNPFDLTDIKELKVNPHDQNPDPATLTGSQGGHHDWHATLTAPAGATGDWGIKDPDSGVIGTSHRGQYGSLTVDPVTGQVTYHVDPNNGAIQKVGSGINGDETEHFVITLGGQQNSQIEVEVHLQASTVHGNSGHFQQTIDVTGMDIHPVAPDAHDADVIDGGVDEAVLNLDGVDASASEEPDAGQPETAAPTPTFEMPVEEISFDLGKAAKLLEEQPKHVSSGMEDALKSAATLLDDSSEQSKEASVVKAVENTEAKEHTANPDAPDPSAKADGGDAGSAQDGADYVAGVANIPDDLDQNDGSGITG